MLTNKEITFAQLEARHGDITAYGYLEQIERATGLAPEMMTGIDPELRLANACRIQDARRNTSKDFQPNNSKLLEAA